MYIYCSPVQPKPYLTRYYWMPGLRPRRPNWVKCRSQETVIIFFSKEEKKNGKDNHSASCFVTMTRDQKIIETEETTRFPCFPVVEGEPISPLDNPFLHFLFRD